MKRVFAGLALCLLTTTALAEQINVDYKRFYSHVNKLGDDDTKALQFAFGFVRVGEGRLCTINDAKIVTEKQTLPLDVTSENRFTVPKDKILKMAEAIVVIELEEAANVCDMSVQLETLPEYLRASYTGEELRFLLEQYEAFFNEMGGFLSFLMPSVQGLMIHFSDNTLNVPIKGAPTINGGMLILDKAWLSENKGLTLPDKPLRVTALAKSQ